MYIYMFVCVYKIYIFYIYAHYNWEMAESKYW